jgi:ribonuclease J
VPDAARASGRQLVVVGRAMHRVIQVAIDTGYLPQDFTYLDQNKFSYLDREDVLALCTGSQGEPRAALARISEEQHPDVSLGSGDLVIFSSRTIPGNEKSVGRIQNSLARLGCEIVTDADALVHVTGHPRRGELKQMYGWLKPKVVVPMHGEMRHLQANAQFAKSLGVPDVRTILNGEMARIAPAPTLLVDEAPVGRVFRDGRLIIADGDGPVRERRKLAHVGIVMLALVLSRKGDVVGDPDVEIDGVPYENSEGYSMEDVALDAAEGAVESIPPSRRKDVELVREAVRRSVRAAVDQAWGKKPIVKVLITQLDGKG